MHEIHADRAKNRIYLRMDGFLRDDEVREVVEQFIKEINTLRPGFDVINNLSSFKPATPEGAKEIERMIRCSNERGVRYVMRIAGPNVIARMQFDRINKTSKSSNLIEYVTSREEAERRLDELESTAHDKEPSSTHR